MHSTTAFACRRASALHAVQLYRLVVLPVANTWMSWTLLRKLAWAPGSRTVALLAVLVLLFTAAGLQVRPLWDVTSQLMCTASYVRRKWLSHRRMQPGQQHVL